MEPTNRLPDGRFLKEQLAERLRSFLREAHGETGGEHLAAMLGLPPRTLRNYENGCTMPAEILLAVIAISNVHPHWLATGLGPKYLPNPANDRRDSDPGCAA